MAVFVVFKCINVFGVVGGRIITLVVCKYLFDVWIIIVCYGFLFAHFHPFAASWSIVVTEQLIVCRTTNDHGTIAWRDHSRLGYVLRRTWRQRCVVQAIQFLVVLESMFQKFLETNSIDCNFSSCIRVQCVSRCVHLFMYLYIYILTPVWERSFRTFGTALIK